MQNESSGQCRSGKSRRKEPGMTRLSKVQIDTFWRDGAVVVPDAVSPDHLTRLQSDLAGWVTESRAHGAAFGEIMDGRPRFDVEPDHSADTPALRRVASPTEISADYEEVAFNSAIADMVADLIGPDVRFHHVKVNSKLPQTRTSPDRGEMASGLSLRSPFQCRPGHGTAVRGCGACRQRAIDDRTGGRSIRCGTAVGSPVRCPRIRRPISTRSPCAARAPPARCA